MDQPRTTARLLLSNLQESVHDRVTRCDFNTAHLFRAVTIISNHVSPLSLKVRFYLLVRVGTVVFYTGLLTL